MVEWLAGNRIRGTSTERTTGAGFNPVDAVVGGWKLLTRSTVGAGGNTSMGGVTISDPKRYYMVLIDTKKTAALGGTMTINGATSTYSQRKWKNGGTTSADVNQAAWYDMIRKWGTGSGLDYNFNVFFAANKLNSQKIIYGCQANTNGTDISNPPDRAEFIFKNTLTDRDITNFALQVTTSSFAEGSEVIVLGYDPDDTHTTNFWEQLHTDSQTGKSISNIDSGTFTNKKYLWVQLWCKGTGNTTVKMTVNNSTDSTYAYRYSNDGNGGNTDPTAQGTQANVPLHNTKANDDKFINMFIINNGSNEILGIAHTAEGNSSGGSGSVNRRETVFKRSTATAITNIEFDNDDIGNFTDWEFKIWGSN